MKHYIVYAYSGSEDGCVDFAIDTIHATRKQAEDRIAHVQDKYSHSLDDIDIVEIDDAIKNPPFKTLFGGELRLARKS